MLSPLCGLFHSVTYIAGVCHVLYHLERQVQNLVQRVSLCLSVTYIAGVCHVLYHLERQVQNLVQRVSLCHSVTYIAGLHRASRAVSVGLSGRCRFSGGLSSVSVTV